MKYNMQYDKADTCLSDLLAEEKKSVPEMDKLYRYEKIFRKYGINRIDSCKLRMSYLKEETFEQMVYALLAEKQEKKSVFYLPRPNKDYDERMASLELILGDSEDAKIHGSSALMTTGAGFMKHFLRSAYFVLPLAALTSAALVGIARSPTLWNVIWTSFIAESIQSTYIDNLPDIKKPENELIERAKKMDSILSGLHQKYSKESGDPILTFL
jgi:hypothetical protein